MNPFVEHHQQNICFQYPCFDRMLLNALVQTMQQPAMIGGFLDEYRRCRRNARTRFREISDDASS